MARTKGQGSTAVRERVEFESYPQVFNERQLRAFFKLAVDGMKDEKGKVVHKPIGIELATQKLEQMWDAEEAAGIDPAAIDCAAGLLKKHLGIVTNRLRNRIDSYNVGQYASILFEN